MVPFETLSFLEILYAPREMEAGFTFNSFASLTNGIFGTAPITIIKLQFLIFATMTPLLRQLNLKITNNIVLP